MNADILKRVVRAIANRSQQDLDRLAHKIVENERRTGHTQLADQLQSILKQQVERQNGGHGHFGDGEHALKELPLSRRHGESLATIVHRESLEHHMVLPAETEHRFTRIECEYAARERLGAHGLRPRKTILLYGPPGCGKSLGAKRLAWNTGLPLMKVRFDALLSSFFGESASNLRSVFTAASQPPGPAFDRDQAGTSFAAPKVTRIAALLQAALPNEPALLYRALIVQSAKWPAWAEAMLTELRQPDLQQRHPDRRNTLIIEVSKLIRCLGYGIPDEARATSNSDFRTTFITHNETSIKARECHIYQVPIPPELRSPADEFDIRIDVTLSYVAQPRRTRRNLRRYLSTWVDWKSNKLGERMNDFRQRSMKDVESDGDVAPASVLPWTLHENSNWGFIRDTKRGAGTVQKDWAVVKSNTLPDHFCIAVVGHPGWSHDPDSAARYTMAVTFEILGQEISIYEPLRNAVIELEAEVALEVELDAEVEAEVEVEE